MRKRIKLALLPLLFSIVGWAFPQTAQAQFLGYTSPQTTTSYPFGASGTPPVPTSIACSGTPGFSGVNAIQNVGQSSHFAYLSSNDITSGTMMIQGSNDGVNFNNISETATIAGALAGTPNSFVVGSGYYNFVRISVNCNSGGHFFVQYSGTSVTPGQLFGAQQLTQYDKSILVNANALTNFTSQFIQPPFGTAAGFLTVYYTSIGGGFSVNAGSTVTVQCTSGLAQGLYNIATFTIPGISNGTVTSPFVVPPLGCHSLDVVYASAGGAGSPLVTIDYVFTLPGLLSNTNSWGHITGTTATAVKAVSGTLHSLTVNTAAAGTVSVFDLAAGACTGTPATNPFAVVTVATTGQFTYDAFFQNGICIKAAVAMDLTATFN